jgi:hypothetical protein
VNGLEHLLARASELIPLQMCLPWRTPLLLDGSYVGLKVLLLLVEGKVELGHFDLKCVSR